MANPKVDIQLDNGTNDIHAKGDAATNALLAVNYDHHEIHEGKHFFIEDVQDIAINNVLDIQWTTPNTTEWANFAFELNCEAETEWFIYEGVNIILAGTAMTAINNNRNSANTSNAVIKSIANTSVANANLDTAVAGATELAHGIVGAGQNGGIINRDDEIIFKQNTNYCLRAVANAAGYTNFRMSWYEHTNIA